MIEFPVVGFGARVAPLATMMAVAPNELPCDMTVVPLLRNVPPVYVLVPESVSSPGPDMVRPIPLPVILLAILRPLLVLYWLTIRSVPLPEVRLPPVMIARLASVLVTRMPPEVIVLLPESVTVYAPFLLKRRLLVVEPDDARSWCVTVVLLPDAQVSLV